MSDQIELAEILTDIEMFEEWGCLYMEPEQYRSKLKRFSEQVNAKSLGSR